VASIQDWDAFGKELVDAACAILGTSNIVITERGAGDVKVLAATLLIRTISNFKGIRLMIASGMIVAQSVSS
jgi:hypothetical protein